MNTPFERKRGDCVTYLEHGRSAAEDDVGVESPADVDGAVLHDLVHRLRDRRHEVGVGELKKTSISSLIARRNVFGVATLL